MLNQLPTTTAGPTTTATIGNVDMMMENPSSSVSSVTDKNEDGPTVHVLEPGLVVIRNFLDDKTCEDIAKQAYEWGEQGEDGFYTKKSSSSSSEEEEEAQRERTLNTGEKGRGRIYDAITRFPSQFGTYHKSALTMARNFDTQMPNGNCTHVILNMYTNSDGLVWHRDIYENDGIGLNPIVNVCVGASCIFGLQHEDTDPQSTIKLSNGDCIIFGGPCRYIKHAVLDVDLDDCPIWMKEKYTPVRFSFTFRDSPNIIGREHEFKYFNVEKDLVGQDEYGKKEDNSSEKVAVTTVATMVSSSEAKVMVEEPPITSTVGIVSDEDDGSNCNMEVVVDDNDDDEQETEAVESVLPKKKKQRGDDGVIPFTLVTPDFVTDNRKLSSQETTTIAASMSMPKL